MTIYCPRFMSRSNSLNHVEHFDARTSIKKRKEKKCRKIFTLQLFSHGQDYENFLKLMSTA